MTDFSLFAKNLDRLPTVVARAILPEDDIISEMSDSDLIRAAKPDSIDWELRLRLARKLADFESGKVKRLLDQDFYDGICPEHIWKSRMRNLQKAAFIGRPMHNFGQATDNLITAITSRFYEMVSIPLIGLGGKVDHKSVKLLIDMAKLLLDRKHGSAVQRALLVQAALPVNLSNEQVEAEIKSLEAELVGSKKSLPGGVAKIKETETGSAIFDEC